MSLMKETNEVLPHTYSELSYDITRSLSKTDKKKGGIFFTPPTTVYRILDDLKMYFDGKSRVLEPSCGSCEFITAIRSEFPNAIIDGVEFNGVIYDGIKHLEDTNTTLYQDNFLTREFDQSYNVIVGNPPYFVMKKAEVAEEYHPYFDGRPNIFVMFILKSLKLLSKNGILAFVLPKNFLNCLYYDKTRKHIVDNYTIKAIYQCDDNYIETKQDTIVIVVQNKKPTSRGNKKFVINVGEYSILGNPDEIKSIRKLYKGATSLSELGFNVRVGSVVWNQCKDILTDDDTQTRLIYSSDIKEHTLGLTKYKNAAKKNYIQKEGVSGPMLVVNRGYGVGKYNFEYCLIEGGFDYLIENHLIYIECHTGMSDEELIHTYSMIITSFEDPRTKKFIETYFGNNAINTTELQHVLPIYID